MKVDTCSRGKAKFQDHSFQKIGESKVPHSSAHITYTWPPDLRIWYNSKFGEQSPNRHQQLLKSVISHWPKLTTQLGPSGNLIKSSKNDSASSKVPKNMQVKIPCLRVQLHPYCDAGYLFAAHQLRNQPAAGCDFGAWFIYFSCANVLFEY